MMSQTLSMYSTYKDSGVKWLGKVPKHWSIERLKSVVTNVIEQTAIRRNGDLYVALEHVESWTGRLRIADSDAVFDSQVKRFRLGDVLFGKLRPYLAKVTLASSDGVCVGEFLVLRPRTSNVGAPYLEQLLRSKLFIDVVSSSTFGAKMPRADWQFIGGMPIMIPSPDEQAAIVKYLDFVGWWMQRCIRAKQKLIKLLEEQKQAIIHRTVTRGLDPSVPLKPSGIPWLGDIPQHWEVLRSKYIYSEVDERSATGQETHLSMSQKFGLIPSSQIEEKRLVSESYTGAKLCKKGDLVLNRLKAHLGVFALAPERGLVSPDYTVFRPVRELDGRYFEAVYRTPACRVELRQRAKGIVQGFWRLYTDDFYDIRIPVPPVDEQKRIMAKIDIDLSGVFTAISRLEREIELLREYRTRLVADVVTGKLDVREAAASLPKEDVEEKDLECSEIISDPEDEGEAQEFQVIEVED